MLRVLVSSFMVSVTLLAVTERCNDSVSAQMDSGSPCLDCRLFPFYGYYSPFVAGSGALVWLLQMKAMRRAKK